MLNIIQNCIYYNEFMLVCLTGPTTEEFAQPESVGHRNFSAISLDMIMPINKRAVSRHFLKSQRQQFKNYVSRCSLEYVNGNCIFCNKPTVIFILIAVR